MPRGFDPATAIKKSAIETCTFAAPYAILHAVFCWIGQRLLADRRIVLCAINRELNVFRSWRCDVEPDLFGALVVSVKFGRIGTKGRTIRHTMADEASAERFVRRALARRASAQKRCGAAYRTVESVGFDEFARPPAAQ